MAGRPLFQIDPPDGSLPRLAVSRLRQRDGGMNPLAIARLILRSPTHGPGTWDLMTPITSVDETLEVGEVSRGFRSGNNLLDPTDGRVGCR